VGSGWRTYIAGVMHIIGSDDRFFLYIMYWVVCTVAKFQIRKHPPISLLGEESCTDNSCVSSHSCPTEGKVSRVRKLPDFPLAASLDSRVGAG
jgi:hypothetical protein